MPLDLLIAALDLLEVNLPYGVRPFRHDRLQCLGGDYPWITEDEWAAWRWNPPEGSPHLVAQEGADAKPTWRQVSAAAISILKERAIARLRRVCSSLITTRAFAARNLEDERNVRLRALEAGTELADEIAAMASYRTRYTALRQWVMGLTDLHDLEILDFSDPLYWGPTWSPPSDSLTGET
jgi:hypothetical protein